jgi:anti-anti-sigma regulatory factor
MKQKTYNCRLIAGKDGKCQSLILEGDLGLRNSSAIGTFLNSAKFNSEKIIIQLRNVEKLDITTIQYLIALQHHLILNKVQTEINAELPEEITRLLGNTGFSSLL